MPARSVLVRWLSTLAIVASVAFVFVAASAEETSESDATLAPMGATLFARHCASCHGLDARGGGPAAASLRVAPPDLTRIAERRDGSFPRGEIGRFIDGRFEIDAHGTRQMPVWGRQFGASVPESGLAEELARGNIAALLDHLEAIQADGRSSTRATMAEIFDALRVLLPLAFDEKALGAPESTRNVEGALSRLAAAADALDEHGERRELTHLGHSLAADARAARRHYEAGRIRATGFAIGQLTGTCVACHSRLPGDDSKLSTRFVTREEIAKLPIDQRASIQYATRQFEGAQQSFEALFASDVPAGDIGLMGLVDDYIELCLRVKQDPQRAVATLRQFAARDDLYPAQRDEVAAWIASLEALVARSPKRSALDEADALLAVATDTERFETSREALVYHLAASGVLHRFIATQPESRQQVSDAYYRLGLIETRTGRSFWLSEAEAFLEASIHAAPASATAQEALLTLEDHLVVGYTGSSGTHLPDDVVQELDALRRKVEAAQGGPADPGS